MSNKIQYLTILDTCRIQGKNRNYLGYTCKCICGNIKQVRKIDYTRNFVTSCGCITSKLRSIAKIKEIPKDTKFGLLTVLTRTDQKSSEGYKYTCKCECGNTIDVYTNRLKRGETKSCGCASIRFNSLNNGGTGIPRENLSLQEAIRSCDEYKKFIATCLLRAQGKSEISGTTGEILHVHHLDSVSFLIIRDELTMASYLSCKNLFDPTNAIVLTASEHLLFHKQYGKTTTISDWKTYSESELIIVG